MTNNNLNNLNNPTIDEFIDILIKKHKKNNLIFIYNSKFSSAQINILTIMYLYKDLSIKEISDFTKISLPGISQMIGRLVKEGCVIKENVNNPSQNQNKKKIIKLTENGNAIVEEAFETQKDFYFQMKELYSEKELLITKQAIDIFLNKQSKI